MKKKYIKINSLKVSENLLEFVNKELLKDTEISSEKFWNGLDKVVDELSNKNRALLKTREILQKKLMNGILNIKELKLK